MMKAIVYSAKKIEKEPLINACGNKHELTWHPAALSPLTARHAAGHQAAIVFTNDEVSCSVIANLAKVGIKYIITRSVGTDHIDFNAAAKHEIQVKNVPEYSPYAVAEHTLALVLALNRHLIEAYSNCRDYDFSISHLIGFNLHGKTVGVVGLGRIGQASAKIFKGFGCDVLGYDSNPEATHPDVSKVDFERLLKESDIISLHIPLTDATFHMIDKETIALMKTGLMLINTARGAVVNTADVLNALNTGKIGYYGADVYEFERGLFFEDHETDQVRDALLTELMSHPNVLITPHQAFLTIEALRDIAAYTVKGLDEWEEQLSTVKVKSLGQIS